MKKYVYPLQALRLSVAALASAFALTPSSVVNAEDIDLFVSAASSTTANSNPNVLFIIDNTSNWARNDQHWTDPNGLIAPFKQGQSELRALKRVIEEANDKVNVGLMMFHDGSPSGSYVRYAVRTMTDGTTTDPVTGLPSNNKGDLAALIGDNSCVDGVGANGTPKCIFKNFTTGEQVSNAFANYSGALFEAFKYFGGCTSPAFAQSGQCKESPLGPTGFGVQRYSNSALSGVIRYDRDAYNASLDSYITPAGTANSCAKNYVVFIGNGFPQNTADTPASLLSGVEGSTSQLAMPQFNTIRDKIIGQQCGTGGNATQRKSNCEAAIPPALKAANPAESYICINERVDPSCTQNNSRLFDVQATNLAQWTVTATGTSAVPSSTDARFADEWARYLVTTDVNGAAGVQNVQTYTIDVFKDQQDQNQTALLFSMAKYGGGRYFQASSEEAVLEALRSIMIEIQSVNTVFASASLPINATNRSQNENQVFIGMFRPDPAARPRWYGNLKRYQIAEFGKGQFKLADASNPPKEAVSGAFIDACAKSFWTTDTTSFNNLVAPPEDTSYWNFSESSGSHVGLCTSSPTSLFSDEPDGPQVEKGATAQVVRLGNDPTATPDFVERRTIYTCANTGTTVSCNTYPNEMHTFNTTNIAPAAVGEFLSVDRDDIVNFSRGVDVKNDNSRLGSSDVRPSVHGDVAHSRPLPVNYAGGVGVVLYYGANDGSFRAVRGRDGKELWAFIAPEHHGKLKRLYHNAEFFEGLISYPPTPAPGSAPKDYFFDGSAGLFQNADDSLVWIFPSMRRGGRMLYAFDVTAPEPMTTPAPAGPRLKWRIGCTDASLSDTASCIDASGAASTAFAQMGQTWSTPAVARIKGYASGDPNTPVIIVGGGYDTCEDQDAAPNVACTDPGYTRRGNRVFVIDANNGALIRAFNTNGSVPADVTLVDRDFDGLVDHAYAADTTGSIYRIDFVDPANPGTVRTSSAWTITEIGRTTGASRKFLFGPAALPAANKVYLSMATGDRERPLIINYPFPNPPTNPGVLNRAYMLVDDLSTPATPLDLDGSSIADLSTGTDCSTKPVDSAQFPGGPKRGWFINLNAAGTSPTQNVGEQAVTSSTIFAGLIFFSTNRPLPTAPGACKQELGEARGYALNLLTASGAADTLNICGGVRSGRFEGGGLPPSPVTGTVPVGPGGQPVTIMIGGVQRGGGESAPIGAQRVTPTITQRRSRVYWYTDGDK